MHTLQRPITADEIAAYQNAGVVCLRNVLNLGAVNFLRKNIDEAVATLGSSPSGYDLTELTHAYEAADDATLRARSGGQHNVAAVVEHMRTSGEPLLFDQVPDDKRGRFLLDTGVALRIRALRTFVLRGAVVDIAASLLQSGTVRFFGDQIFVKEPGTRERTAWHQDATYFPIDGDQCCVLWIPVDPATLETGVMRYVRGSHRDGALYSPNVFVSQTALPGADDLPVPDIDANPKAYDLVHFDVEPGDIIVHHYRTIHGAGGNISRYQVRRALSARYTGEDIRFKFRPWAPAQPHHSHQLKDGDPLEADDFPVVWRATRKKTAA